MDERVEKEIAATQWAFDHANYWPSDGTIIYMLNAIATYTDEMERQNKAYEKLEQEHGKFPWEK